MRKVQEGLQIFVSRFLSLFICIFIFIIVLVAIMKPDEYFWEGAYGNLSIKLLLTFFSIWFIYFLGCIYNFIITKRINKVAIAITFLFVLFFQFLIVFYLKTNFIWDNSKIYECALSFANGREPLNDFLGMYPHQAGAAMATTLILKIFMLSGLREQYYVIALSYIMVLFTDFSIWIMALLTTKIMGKKRAGKIVLFLWILSFLSPSVIIWGNFYYPTVLSLPFFSLTIFYGTISLLEHRNNSNKSILYSFLMIVCGYIGYKIRATVFIVIIAFIITLFYQSILKFQKWKKTALIFGIMIVVILLSSILYNFFFSKLAGSRDKDLEYPLLNWVMIGVSDGGVYNYEDAVFIENIEGDKEKTEAIKQLIVERVTARGITGNLDLLGNKIYTMWGNGTRDIFDIYCQSNQYGWIHDWIVGEKSGLFSTYSQIINIALWSLILFLCISDIKNKRIFEDWELFLWLIMIGNFLFYLVWEVQGQYNISVEPLKLMMVCFSGERIFNNKKIRELFKFKKVLLIDGIFILGMLVCQIKSYNYAVLALSRQEYMAVYQQLSNEKILLGPDSEMAQYFSTNRSFNCIDIHIKNFVGKYNNVNYTISLESDMRGIIYEETISGKDIPLKYLFGRKIDKIDPYTNEKFCIKIIASEGDYEIGLYGYRLQTFDPYTQGELIRTDSFGTTEKINGDLCFCISEELVGSYINKKMYFNISIGLLFVISIPCLVCLLMQFICHCDKNDIRMEHNNSVDTN